MNKLNQTLLKFELEQNFAYDDFFVSKCNYFAFNLIESWPNWEKNIINIHGEKYCSTVLSDGEEIIIESSVIINAAGLNAEEIANNILPLDKKYIPKTYFAKGNYFETGKDLKIRHLIYPIPKV